MIDSQVIQRFFKVSDTILKGDFVVLGGSVVSLIDIDHRTTMDIDLASIESRDAIKFQTDLADIAIELGLPIEAINQSAAYFLYKQDNWKNSLIEVFDGKQCRFYRPNAFLYIKLKIYRLSNSDLQDCMQMIKYAQNNGENLEQEQLNKILRKNVSESNNDGYKRRCVTLINFLEK